MHTIAKSCVPLLLLQLLTSVKCQACTLEKFLKSRHFDRNFATSDLEATYAEGRQVRVPCNVGYTGFFKLICSEGDWTAVGKPCQPKSCGHPGDGQFSDFRLQEGDDFVFGSTVVYECHRGYHMVSRSNRRRCTTNGWDGNIPVCEANNCEIGGLHPRLYIAGIPSTGEAIVAGHKLRFFCGADHKLDGPEEIECLGTGQWSASFPTCSVNTCEIGVLHPHLYISGIPSTGEAITAGRVLQFFCGADHELDGSTESECLKTRQWSAPFPTCSAIRCTVPQIEHGSVPTGPREYKENEVLNFRCGATYKRADDRPPRCTKFAGKADWNPTPACKPIQCELILPPPTGTTYDPPNRNVFLPGEMLRVLCGEKHWILDAQTRESDVTCNYNGVWNARTECQEVKCPAYIEEDHLYYSVNAWGRNKLGDRVTYDCSWGYQTATADKTATCTREGWTPSPLCRAKQCQRPDIVNGRITGNKRKYGNGEQLTYECVGGNPNSVTITCERGAWQGIRPCPGKRDCDKPEIPNGFAVGPLEDKLYYSCNENFKLPTKSWWGEATCKDGAWDELHSCIAKSMCGEAPLISNGRVTVQNRRAKIECNEGYAPETQELTCENGRWSFDQFSAKTICRATAKHCGPPPKVENAIVTVPYQKEYLDNHFVTYQCREKYKIEQEAFITCRDGKWESKNIKCIQWCEKLSDSRLTVETAMEKEEYSEGEVIPYTCTAPGVTAWGNATCENGKWKKTEECPGIPCELPQLDPNLRILGSAPKDNQVNSGTKLLFACDVEYDLEGSDEILCLETGKWDAPLPTCSEKCKRPEVPENVRITSSVQGNALSKGDILSFACNRGTDFMQGSASIECLGNGQWSAPPPQCGAPIVCSAPPPLEDGDIKSYIGSDSVFQHGEKVEYICQQMYTMSGEPFKTCDNGVWIGEMRCLKPCTVNEQLMNTHNIQHAYRYDNKLYAPHKDHLTFVCKPGTTHDGRVPMRVECNDGEMTLPTCQ